MEVLQDQEQSTQDNTGISIFILLLAEVFIYAFATPNFILKSIQTGDFGSFWDRLGTDLTSLIFANVLWLIFGLVYILLKWRGEKTISFWKGSMIVVVCTALIVALGSMDIL